MRIRLTCAVLLGVLLPAGFVKAAASPAQDADAPTVHKNVVYGMHCGLALLMDVYEPAESNGHALLSIAGTGWHWSPDYGAGGIKDAVASGALGGGSTRVFADAGFTVFVINHRQAPLFRYPAAVEDARRAVRYMRHHGDEYGVTEDAIAAFGISSGAHLVLMLALGDGDGDPESADEVERHSSKVDVVASFAGPTDLTAEDWAETRGATYVTSFIGAPNDGLSNGRHRNASPLTYVDGESPPVLLIHGDADDVVPVSQARMLAASLREHEVEFEYVEITGGGHDFDAVLNHDPNELPSFPAMARWLREHLPIDDHYFDSAGMTIRYIDVGPRDGEPVVLVPGGAQSIEDAWVVSGILEALDDDHRVIALDPRGQGKSDKPHDPAAYGNAYVDDIVRLLDHLQIDKAHLVGYSAGGRTVFKMAADHPQRVISALPCGTNAEPLTPEYMALFDRMATSLEESGSIRPGLEHFNADGSLTEAQIDAAVEMVRANNDTKALAAGVRSVVELIPDRARLEANAVPCLGILGAGDPNLALARTTATYMPNLEIHVIEGANHMTAFRDPAFVGAIKTFVAEHAAGDDHYFDSAGMTIRYIDVGPRDGEPVVLIHGFSQRIESAWEDTGVIGALDDEYRVIALDWRGHGKSDTPHAPQAYGTEIVDDVIRLLDHLQLEKAHVVGYSMGGHITFRLLADHPDRVLSVMPCGDAGTHVPDEFDEVARRAVASLRTSGSIRPLIEYFAAPGSMTEDQVMEIVESQRSSNDVGALAAVMRSFRTLDADPAKLAATTVPCLAIIGEHDPFLDGLRRTAENMTDLQIRVVEGHDHITVFQAPEYPAIIKSFLDRHASVRGGSSNATAPR